jgi:hypothetical protein
MTSNESKQKADLIWSKLFSKDGENRTRQEELNIIESIVIQIAQEQRKVGRRQILNHFEEEVKSLRD